MELRVRELRELGMSPSSRMSQAVSEWKAVWSDKAIEQNAPLAPGIVQFRYNEPVVHPQPALAPEIRPQDEKAPEGTPDQFICIYCTDNLRKGTIKPCGHHLVCVAYGDKLMAKKMPCPECRAKITKVEYHY